MERFKIKSQLWLESNGHTFIGYGRVQLLKAVDKMGSISSAARNLGMSYKKAWDLIDAMNRSAPEPLVIGRNGGKGGGGTVLTTNGKRMIRLYETIERECIAFLDIRLKECLDNE